MFASLGLSDIVVLNDFEAQALAVVALGEEHMEKIGGGAPEPNAGRVVLGPGTGLGVAGLIHALRHWIPVPGEGGHMDIGPRTPRDFEVFPHIENASRAAFRASRSCAGAAWSTSTARSPRPTASRRRFTTPAEITAAALAKTDPVAEEALATLRHLPRPHRRRPGAGVHEPGGVFLTGGIAQKIVPALKAAISAPPSRTRRRTAS